MVEYVANLSEGFVGFKMERYGLYPFEYNTLDTIFGNLRYMIPQVYLSNIFICTGDLLPITSSAASLPVLSETTSSGTTKIPQALERSNIAPIVHQSFFRDTTECQISQRGHVVAFLRNKPS